MPPRSSGSFSRRIRHGIPMPPPFRCVGLAQARPPADAPSSESHPLRFWARCSGGEGREDCHPSQYQGAIGVAALPAVPVEGSWRPLSPTQLESLDLHDVTPWPFGRLLRPAASPRLQSNFTLVKKYGSFEVPTSSQPPEDDHASHLSVLASSWRCQDFSQDSGRWNDLR